MADATVPVSSTTLGTNPASVYLARLALSGRKSMSGKLNSIARDLGYESAARCPWHRLEYQHTQAIRTRLAERYSPATANNMLCALRGVLGEAWRLGQLTAEDYRRAADLTPVRGATLPRGRALGADELRRLFAACAADPKPARGGRDAALLAMLYAGGLRRSEAVALDVGDWEPGEGALTVRSGKGRKGRMTFLAADAATHVDAWIIRRGIEPGPLVLPVDRRGALAYRRLSDQAVLDIVRRLAAAAGTRAFSPHDLRRTYVSRLLEAGVDISTVQQLAGHANVATTARYDRRGDGAKRRAAEALCLR